jgi:C4-type Zn-finger protein
MATAAVKLSPSSKAEQRIAELECLLEEIHEFLDDQLDVVDGDYGEPAPNRAMQLSTSIDLAMGRRP